MGYPVSPLSPKITVQGRTFCVSAFEWPTPVGTYFKVGIYESIAADGWDEMHIISVYNRPGDAMQDLKNIGGAAKYMEYVVRESNAFFKALFGPIAPPDATEPTTDEEAKAYMTAHLAALKFTLVDGVPVLSS